MWFDKNCHINTHLVLGPASSADNTSQPAVGLRHTEVSNVAMCTGWACVACELAETVDWL